MKKIVTTFAMLLFMLSIMAIGNAEAYESITAAKAYQMATEEGANLVDVRTLEEYVWLGTCAAEANGMPIAYNIPWQLWGYRIEKADGYYKPTMVTVKTLFKYFIKKTFPDKDTPLILFCRSGHRSTDAAKYLDKIGYTKVYEIDNYLKEADKYPGGKGGFQGGNTEGPADYKGYRGWPGRVSYLSPYPTHDPDWTPKDKDQSVSWMDTGLPVTQKLDPTKIYLYMWLPKYKH
jgi:rhodanese-related sulfurtransferase